MLRDFFRDFGLGFLYVREGLNGAPRVLIDPNGWSKDGATAAKVEEAAKAVLSDDRRLGRRGDHLRGRAIGHQLPLVQHDDAVGELARGNYLHWQWQIKFEAAKNVAHVVDKMLHCCGGTAFKKEPLHAVRAPTLVIHRTHEQWVDVGNSRYLAAHIAGAQLVERLHDVAVELVGELGIAQAETHGEPLGLVEQRRRLVGGHLAFEERQVILAQRILNCVVIRIKCLDQHTPVQFPTPGAPRNLCEQLKGALRGSEVGQVQRGICIDHADERHVRKVESLRDHLRTDDQIEFAFVQRGQRALEVFFAAHRIAIEPTDPCRREHAVQQLFQLFRTSAKEIYILTAAVDARFRYWGGVSAIVAFHAAGALVMRHRNGAVLALQSFAAGTAQHYR